MIQKLDTYNIFFFFLFFFSFWLMFEAEQHHGHKTDLDLNPCSPYYYLATIDKLLDLCDYHLLVCDGNTNIRVTKM